MPMYPVHPSLLYATANVNKAMLFSSASAWYSEQSFLTHLSRYVTVMFSTGPMFVTIQYALYAHKERLAIIPVELYGKYKVRGWVVFK